jgi:hypothetical protein
LTKALLISLIRFYRGFISPMKPPTCRFQPTCSQYAIESLEAHGVVRGLLMAAWRILRCNPFVPGGYDPVPDGDKVLPSGRRDPAPTPGGGHLPAHRADPLR